MTALGELLERQASEPDFLGWFYTSARDRESLTTEGDGGHRLVKLREAWDGVLYALDCVSQVIETKSRVEKNAKSVEQRCGCGMSVYISPQLHTAVATLAQIVCLFVENFRIAVKPVIDEFIRQRVVPLLTEATGLLLS